jgi:tetratricopeptide (TPR) repeat protein
MVSGLTQLKIRKLFDARKYEEALALYRKATQKGPDARDRLSISRLCLKLGRWDEAEEELRKIDRNKLSSLEVLQARINLILAKWKKGDLDDAIRRAEALYAEEKVTLTYATLGYLYIERALAKKDWKKAIAFNKEAMDYNGSNGEIQDNYAQALLESGDWEGALAAYEAMAKQKVPPTFGEWRYHFGQALAKAGRLDEALEQMRLALARGYSALSALDEATVKAAIERLEAKKAAQG